MLKGCNVTKCELCMFFHLCFVLLVGQQEWQIAHKIPPAVFKGPSFGTQSNVK